MSIEQCWHNSIQ